MDIFDHDNIMWQGALLAKKRLGSKAIGDPVKYFLSMSRGSWMNDTNQASLIIDKSPAAVPDPAMHTVFNGLWKLHCKELASVLSRQGAEGASAAAAIAACMGTTAVHAEEIGAYNQFDHLDVLDTNPSKEHDGWQYPDRYGRGLTIDTALRSYVPGRLNASTFEASAASRLDPYRLTVLGRALHQLEDFFAHSNYVELLLWSLAWRNRLSDNVLDAFNGFGSATFEPEEPTRYVPLPLPGSNRKTLFKEGVLLWYGSAPEETPLVSTVFDSRDTVCSLLKIYIANLTREDGSQVTDEELDLALAVFDVPGRKLIKAAWGVLDAAKDIVAACGKAARGYLASQLEALSETKPAGTECDLLKLSAALVREYDSVKAADWAKAGRLAYLMKVVEQQFIDELKLQTPATPILPHHALLAKDHFPGKWGYEATGVSPTIRYRLACLFATEATAEVLCQHFGPGTPSDTGYFEMANTRFVHPFYQLESGLLDEARLAKIVEKTAFSEWEHIVANDGVTFIEDTWL
ncbi:MAG TPA: HET-C-related protein [Polyangiaceae bacterium]